MKGLNPGVISIYLLLIAETVGWETNVSTFHLTNLRDDEAKITNHFEGEGGKLQWVNLGHSESVDT